MQSIEPENNDEVSKSANAYAKYSAVVFQMIAIIGAFTYAGYRIDKAENHTTQWVTAMLALTGVFISFYVVFKSLKN